MNHKIKILSAAVLATLAYYGEGMAAPSAEQVKSLGSALTPWGAEVAGNKAGSIPAYTGQGVKIPANFNPAKPGTRPDPFADEKPLYSITAANMDQYAGNLSDGVKEMLKKYPTFRLDVYPTHRTVVYPKWVQDNSLKNATACKSTNGDLVLEGCYAGVPFPIPGNGAQAMWNHLVRYSTPESRGAKFKSWVVDASGRPILQGEQWGYLNSPFFDESITGPVPEGIDYSQLRVDITGPTRKAGEKRLILDSIKMGDGGTRIWQYLPAQRRVKQSPDLAYDTPQPQSGGAQTMDDAYAFSGALDRFDFKLVGKKEVFIPYNTFKMQAGGSCSTEQLLTPNHMNPDCVRWELHRVWVVEGTPKSGVRHVYSKRVMYFDEDVPGAGISDSFDKAGQPYRVNMVFPYPMYENTGEAHSTDRFATFDLATGVYAESGNATESGGWLQMERKNSKFFTSGALTNSGIR
ncbi:hypothetical protein D3C78_288830 [compost metagenome]